jgi:hypothetical protein
MATGKRISGLMVLVAFLFVGSGCVGNIGANLSSAILNHPDPETVRESVPAYLLLIDSLIADDPKDEDLLQTGANLYALYASAFIENGDRAALLAGIARGYGERALCSTTHTACGLSHRPFDEFSRSLRELDEDEVPALFSYTITWLVWIKTHSSDWAALADLPKVEAALERIVELDEGYRHGSAHLYLGILKTMRPPSLGGHPEEGRRHFERALALSCGRDLGFKIEFARNYARLVYDRELHDRLLNEVIAADPVAPDLTLLNILAKRQARLLLDSAEDYF